MYNLHIKLIHNLQCLTVECLSREQQVSWLPLELGKVMFAVQTHHNTRKPENQENVQIEIEIDMY